MIVFAGIITGFTDSSKETQTAGDMVFTFKTVTNNGNYAPKHVLAVWVEDSNGFVKSRLVKANQRKQYLYSWIAASNWNEVDAVTGSTINSHQTHTVEWDCTDLSGNEVPDGDYTVWVEFTEKHAQGPTFSVTFTKGATYQHLTPSNTTNFINLDLEFTPNVVTADFSSNVQTTCVGGEVVFTDNSNLATSYEWDFGVDAIPATANTVGPHLVTYSSPGAKTVSLTVNGSVVQTYSNYITVETTPVADFTHTLGNNLEVEFTSTATDATSWEWDFGDGNTSTLEHPVHTYSMEGYFDVQLTATNGNCDDAFTQTISVANIGIETNERMQSISIFPNPNNGIFNIRIEERNGQPVNFRIFNSSGKIVFQQSVFAISSDVIPIDAELAPGIYFVKVQNGDNIDIEELVVL